MKEKITDKVLKSIGKRIERNEFGRVELAHVKKILKNIPDCESKPLMADEQKRADEERLFRNDSMDDVVKYITEYKDKGYVLRKFYSAQEPYFAFVKCAKETEQSIFQRILKEVEKECKSLQCHLDDIEQLKNKLRIIQSQIESLEVVAKVL